MTSASSCRSTFVPQPVYQMESNSETVIPTTDKESVPEPSVAAETEPAVASSKCNCTLSTCVHSDIQMFTLYYEYSDLYDQLKAFLESSVKSNHASRSVSPSSIVDELRTLCAAKTQDSIIYDALRRKLFPEETPQQEQQSSSGSPTGPGVVNAVFSDENSSHRAESRVKQILRQLPPSFRPKSVLDLGCGDGAILTHLASKLNVSSKDTYGCDVIPLGEEKIKGRFVFYQTPSSGSPTLPCPDGSVELVTAMMSLHHIKDVVAYVTELYRVTAPGGRLIIREHDCSERNKGTWMLIDVIHGLYSLVLSMPQEDPNFSQNYFAHYRSCSSWRDIIEDVGFRVDRNNKSRNSEAWGPQKFYFDVFIKSSSSNDDGYSTSAAHNDGRHDHRHYDRYGRNHDHRRGGSGKRSFEDRDRHSDSYDNNKRRKYS